MADNVVLNSGSGGATILTDDCTTGHAQINKLAVSADGDATLIPATAANGLLVDVKRVQGTVTVDASGAAVPVTDNGGSLTVDGSVTANAGTNLNTSALALESGGNLATVAALSKAEDAAHSSGHTGVVPLAVRRDAAAVGSDTDGDYSTLNVDSSGQLRVNVGNTVTVGSHAVTNAGTFATQATLQAGTAYAGKVRLTDGTNDTTLLNLTSSKPLPVAIVDTNGDQLASIGGGTQYTEDAAAAANPVGTALNLVRDDARGGSLTTTDGDNVAARGTNAGELYVKHVDAIPVTDNSGSLTVDNGGTFAVQVSSALPAGANAIGKLAANSGVDIGDVDVTSVTPGTTASALGKAEDAAHSSGDVGVLAMAVRRDTAAVASDTDGDYSTLNVDANGRLHVNVGNTVTVGSHAVTNAGTFAVQVDGAALTALQLIDDPVIADDAAFTPATTKVMMAGFEADESSTDSVDEGDGGAARMTLDRKIIVAPQPHTAGGLSIFRSLDLDETEEDVKTSAGCVYSVWATNTATSTRFLKFYNATAANTTVGSTTPVITIGLPGNSSDDISAHFTGGGFGIVFDTAICVAATTGVADADTGAPAANDVVVNIFYK